MTHASRGKLEDSVRPAGPGSVLVTGASGGIGQAVSLAFGKAGWCVGIHYHQAKDSAERTLRHIERAGSTGALYQADVRDAQAMEQMVNVFSQHCPPPLCFVCTAGIGSGRLA